MKETLTLFGVLLLLGAGWGITMPLTKITVAAGYQHFGLIFWQFVISALIMGLALAARKKLKIPNKVQWCFAAMIALIGTLLPNSASYQAAVHLPSGVISILLSLIPMLAFPIALAFGTDRFSARKLIGLCLGFAAVALIALHGDSFAGDVSIWWVAIALIAPAFYALEGNIVAKWGTHGLDSMQTLFWASMIGILPSLGLALWSGQYIAIPRVWAAPEYAFVLSSIAHALVYSGYVWLVGRAGSVFAAQVSYLVTIFGIFWAVTLLNESYAAGIWSALALTLCGLFLVQPRRQLVANEAII